MKIKPRKSVVYFGSLNLVSLIANKAPTRAVIPIGILMKNAQRQVRVGSLVKYPPKTGPRTAAAPAVAPHIPKATLRALLVEVVVRSDRVEGEAEDEQNEKLLSLDLGRPCG